MDVGETRLGVPTGASLRWVIAIFMAYVFTLSGALADEPPGQLADPPAHDLATSDDGQTTTADASGDASLSIAENTQNTFRLRELLGKRQFRFFGRLEGDAAGYNIPSFVGQDGAEIRRFRIGLAGLNPWFRNISYKVEFDLTDGASTISDAYLNFDFGDRGNLTVGNQDGSQSLSASTGSLSQLFMEEPLVISAFSLDKRVGIAYDRYQERSGMHLLLFGRDLNDENAEHRGIAFRGWLNPNRSSQGIWHIGGSYIKEYVNSSNRLDSRPESHVTDIELVDTGVWDDVMRQTRYGFEAAGATRSFTSRLEVLVTEWKHDNGDGNRFTGAYFENGLCLTGQPFRYTDGKFIRPNVRRGDYAVEAVFRLSWLDLNDGDVQGGKEFNVGAGANVYPRQDLRGQINVIYVDSDRPDSDGWLMQARLQFNW